MTERHREERKELIMRVEGMTGQACADAVADAIRRLDPSAEIAVDLDHRRITVRTFAQSLEIAETLGKAGYQATGMTLKRSLRQDAANPLPPMKGELPAGVHKLGTPGARPHPNSAASRCS